MRSIATLLIGLMLVGLTACGSNLYSRARIYEERGDYRSALDAYQRMAETSSGHDQALANAALGRLYVKLGRYWEARDRLEQAKQEIPSGDPAYAEVNYYLGICYYEIGDQWAPQAIEAFNAAAPSIPRAHLYLCVLYYEQGEYQAALRHAERISGSDESRAKYISGLVYRKLGGLENLQKAMLAFQRAVERERDLEVKRKYQQMLDVTDRDIRELIAKAQKFEEVQIQPVFAAIYPYYQKHPIGRVTLYNPTGDVLQGARLTLEVEGFTDAPEMYELGSIDPRSKRTVDLTVHFSSKMGGLQQDQEAVPVRLQLSYTVEGQSRVETAPPQYVRVHGINALKWDPPESIAAFVTHTNEAVAVLARHAAVLGNPLEKAIQIYEALHLYGVQYELDPEDPYGEGVDYVFYPYQTLQHRKGDCDDLSVLYAACLQNIGVDTAFVLTPTHVYVMFNTGMSDDRAKRVIPDRNLYISRERMAWIPVEITMLGKEGTGFFDAWLKGAEEFRSEYSVVDVAQAWREFQPLSQGETLPDLAQALPGRDAILKAYNHEVAKAEAHWQQVFQKDLEYLDQQLAGGKGERADLLNKRAIRLAWLERYTEAEQALREAASSAPSVVRYHNNLANVLFLQGRTDEALQEYQTALEGTKTGAIPVRLNLAIYYLAMQRSDEAQQQLAMLGGTDPNQRVSDEVLILARELGVPITGSPRAGDLPALVKDKIGQVASTYQQVRTRKRCIDQILARLEEGIPDEDRARLATQLERLSLESLQKIAAQGLSGEATRDLILEPSPPPASEVATQEAEAPTAEAPAAAEAPAEEVSQEPAPSEPETAAEKPQEHPAEAESPEVAQAAAGETPPSETSQLPKISREQLEQLLTSALDLEVAGTRASGISEPEGLQWWLYWME